MSTAIARYQKRISSQLLNCINIHIEVPRVDYEKPASKRNTENLEAIRKHAHPPPNANPNVSAAPN